MPTGEHGEGLTSVVSSCFCRFCWQRQFVKPFYQYRVHEYLHRVICVDKEEIVAMAHTESFVHCHLQRFQPVDMHHRVLITNQIT